MGSTIDCSRDNQPVPMHGDVFRDAVADLRDYLLAPPHTHGWPEIGSADAVSCRIVVTPKPHQARSCIERNRPFGICSELRRDWQGRPRAVFCTGNARAESPNHGSGSASEKHCSPRDLCHHLLHRTGGVFVTTWPRRPGEEYAWVDANAL